MDIALTIVALTVVAAALSALANRLRTPPPVLLVVVGFGIGLLPGVPAVHVAPEVIVLGVLPPLLFAAADQLSLPHLREVWQPVAALSLGLVLATATVVAVVTHALVPRVSLDEGFVLGAILASTDPVAVTALSRRLHMPPRVAALVQGESLFNDATSLVLFQVAVAGLVRGELQAGNAVARFVLLAGGGVAVGAVGGLAASWSVRRIDRPGLQALVAVITPYAVALAATGLRVSAVTAVVVAGLLLARRRRLVHDRPGRVLAERVYARIVAVVEDAVFALIGLTLAAFVDELPGADQRATIVLLAVLAPTLLLVRGAAVAAGTLLPGAGRAWRNAAVVIWAGTRGVVPLAAALAVPTTVHGGGPFPHRALIVTVAVGATVVGLAVQGSTLERVVRLTAADPATDGHPDPETRPER